jgi:hypothetical protein
MSASLLLNESGVHSTTNTSACDALDASIEELSDMRDVGSSELFNPTGVTLPSVTLLVSLVLLAAGGRIFRLAAAFSAGVLGFGFFYYFVRSSNLGISCTTSIVGSGVISILLSFAAGCIVKAGLFFVGAAAMAGFVHMTYTAFPMMHTIGNQPAFVDKSIAYWILLVLSALVGGLTVRYNDKPILEILTSCLGGAGMGYALRSFNDTLGENVPRWVFVIIGFLCTILGIIVQRRSRIRNRRQRRSDE